MISECCTAFDRLPVELRLGKVSGLEEPKKYRLPSSHPITAPSGIHDELLVPSSDAELHGRMSLVRDCEKLDAIALWVLAANVRESETFMTCC